jgi:hypothetical protein
VARRGLPAVWVGDKLFRGVTPLRSMQAALERARRADQVNE